MDTNTMPDGEIYRPLNHFSPRSGWINDPNGLILVDGVWHAFFQHYPGGTTHGPMHWGHATSRNLVDWTEQPVALYPDELGTCFSGSAIRTPAGDVELFYTAHRTRPDGTPLQTQCLAHARDGLASFSREPGNPIIPNPGLAAFRDPKVVWHAETGRWIMVLTHGQAIGFYSSLDRRLWRLESTFGEGEGRHGSGPWECPDLVRMTGPDGRSCWVLVVGIGADAYAPGSGTQYFLGTFDGRRFRNLNSPSTELWLDFGRDFYAAQSFFGAPGDAAVVLAWASNWCYARATPTQAFRGSFSLPRELALVETADGLRIAARVPSAVADRFPLLDPGAGDLSPAGGVYRLRLSAAAGQAVSIALFGEAEPQIILDCAGVPGASIRLVRAPQPDMPGFAHDYAIPLPGSTSLDVEIFVDNGLVELCANAGQVWATNLHFPARPDGGIRVAVVD